MMKIALPLLLTMFGHADDGLQTALERVPETPPYLRDCFEAASDKLASIAKSQGGVLDASSIELHGVDDRSFNPFKYVYFTAVAERPDGSREILRVVTQKSFLPPKACF